MGSMLPYIAYMDPMGYAIFSYYGLTFFAIALPFTMNFHAHDSDLPTFLGIKPPLVFLTVWEAE